MIRYPKHDKMLALVVPHGDVQTKAHLADLDMRTVVLESITKRFGPKDYYT